MNHRGKYLLRANAIAKRVILLNWKYAEGLKLAELYTGLSELTRGENNFNNKQVFVLWEYFWEI